MKLLFDQHLSPRLVKSLADIYPDSDHVYPLGLDQADDKEIWDYARREGFLIATKDADFSDLCLLLGCHCRRADAVLVRSTEQLIHSEREEHCD